MGKETWIKEIRASCASHFNTTEYHYKIEEDDKKTSEWDKWAEFRMLGPNVLKLNNINDVTGTINILLSVVRNKNNAYTLNIMAGAFLVLFIDIDIPLLGCFRLRQTVDFTPIGMATEDKISYATLEAPYSMLLQG